MNQELESSVKKRPNTFAVFRIITLLVILAIVVIRNDMSSVGLNLTLIFTWGSPLFFIAVLYFFHSYEKSISFQTLLTAIITAFVGTSIEASGPGSAGPFAIFAYTFTGFKWACIGYCGSWPIWLYLKKPRENYPTKLAVLLLIISLGMICATLHLRAGI